MDKNANGTDEKKCHRVAIAAAQTHAMVTIKRERLDDDIKEYAETAMNELLGWYGYSNNNNNNKETPKKDAMRSNLHQHHAVDEDSLEGTVEKERIEELKLRAQLQQQQLSSEMRKSSGNSSGSESPKSTEFCGWCGKSVDDSTGLSSNNAIFCSELCFSQSRRANFKKNKTCDWCKHVRHTVSYVDFQDGASQLQFCSDKCLNQYKMHIFCRETRAHLEMHPHLLSEDTTSGLITPDLWMRNCKSPSSRTSSPVSAFQAPARVDEPQTSPLPLITVAHPSKLLASPPSHEKNTSASMSHHMRKKRLRKRSKNHSTEKAQDLRVRPTLNAPATVTTNPSNGHHDFPELSSRLFASGPPTGGFNFARFNGAGLLPSHQPIQLQANSAQAPPEAAVPPAGLAGMLPFGFPGVRPNVMPPVTVMVPYPVMLPIPIPIPIPLPLSAFLQAAKLSKTSQNGNCTDTNHLNGNHDQEGTTPMTSTHSDDEEIGVEDVRQTNEHDETVKTKRPTRELRERKELGASPNVLLPIPIGPIQLRKRKRDADAANNGKINVNCKHKKSLSV